MQAKSSSQNALFLTFFYLMFANCVHTKTISVHVFEREIFFSPNCSKFAVECDGILTIFKTFKICFFFGKMNEFFSKKFLKFFKIATCGKFFHVFSYFFEGFLGKNQKKFKVGKVTNNDEETEYFEKKKRFHPLNGHL